MKKILCFFILNLGIAGALHAGNDFSEKSSVAKKTAIVPQNKALNDARKRAEEKKAELNGSRWNVEMNSTDPKVGKTKDKLVFQNGQVSLEEFSGKGFKPTNYTITVPDNSEEMAIWETMQTSEREGTLSIRGEWIKDEMRGIVSHQAGEVATTYHFSSAGKESIPLSTDEIGKKAEKEEPVTATRVQTALVAKETEDELSLSTL